MSETLEYCMNRATEAEIAEHLKLCEAEFIPPLAGRVEIDTYTHRIIEKAARFEAWHESQLIGLVAAYCNDQTCRMAYVTSVSVLPAWHGKAIASRLMDHCIKHVVEIGFQCIELEVDGHNAKAISLYEKKGFLPKPLHPGTMQLTIKRMLG